jgi:hypothetical protein
MQNIAANPADKTKVTLIYANVSEKDILLREEFDRACQGRVLWPSSPNLAHRPGKVQAGSVRGQVLHRQGSKGLEGCASESCHLPSSAVTHAIYRRGRLRASPALWRQDVIRSYSSSSMKSD